MSKRGFATINNLIKYVLLCFSRAFSAAIPGADVDPRRPTSLNKSRLSQRPADFHQPLSTYASQGYLDTDSTDRILCF